MYVIALVILASQVIAYLHPFMYRDIDIWMLARVQQRKQPPPPQDYLSYLLMRDCVGSRREFGKRDEEYCPATC